MRIARNQDAKVDVNLEKGTGVLALTISPSGASIFVEDEMKGTSAERPYLLELPPGSYKVRVSKGAHYRPQNFTMTVVARKTVSREVNLQKIWVKDTTVVLRQDQRVREGMLIAKYPNGTVRLETSPGVFEEYAADEIQTVAPIKAP